MTDKAENEEIEITADVQADSQNVEEELPEHPSDEEFEKRLENPEHAAEETISPDVKEVEDQLLRALAENQNLRNRMIKELEDTRKYAISTFSQDLIGVLENLRRAQKSVENENLEENAALKTLSEGVDLTANELLRVFSKNGIERISPLGEDFDHNFHQALVQIPTAEYEPGKVCQVMAAGYKIKDRLLRPAMVGVAAAATENTETPTEEPKEDNQNNDPSADCA